jgi:endo-1,4-beta-xylanase
MSRFHIPNLSNKLLTTIGAGFITLGIVGIAVAQATSKVSSTPINLLQQSWQYLDGVQQNSNSLTVSPTDSKIVNQDGTGGQSNPAVNLYGVHLNAAGDFSVTTHFTTQDDTTATLQLYDKPPIIADEFRLEPSSIAITKHGSTVTVKIWNDSEQDDPTNPQPVFSQTATLDQPGANIVISRIGEDLKVQSGNTTFLASGKGSVFKSGAVWFGLNSPDGTFTVDTLSANAVDGGTLSSVDMTALSGTTSSTGLQALATKTRPDFKVGAAVALGPWVSDSTYATQLFHNFGSITLENAMKPQFLSPKQGTYTFQEADALIALAHKNGMIVHGHTLAFSEAEPSWMRNLPTATDADKQATAAALLDYVSHVVTHFKGQLDSLDVINEPLDTDQGTDLQQNIWYKAMGPDYMVKVSQLVHSIDPTVKQYVNENGAEMPGDRQDTLLNLIQQINAQGGFIYGVGLQSHVYDMDTDTITSSGLNKTINRFGKVGLKVRISENDVTDDSGTKAQTQQYDTIFMACYHNPNCVEYTTWGVNDRYDYFIDDDGSAQQGHDFLFNGEKATGAYGAIQKSLQ